MKKINLIERVFKFMHYDSMFTGIVQGSYPVSDVKNKKKSLQYSVQLDASGSLMQGLKLGASVSVNGVCQTVVHIKKQDVYFDAIGETLRCTNLGALKKGDQVHIERSLVFGQEIGGHLLSGHVTNQILVQKKQGNTLWFNLPQWLAHFVFEKGYIALDGVSLTIGKVLKKTFCIHLIPYTLQVTRFAYTKPGDWINVEIDSQVQVIVETVKRVLKK